MAPAILTRPAKILFLDAYDSFSNNIVSQVEQCIDAEVTSIHIDDPNFFGTGDSEKTLDFLEYLKNFDGVIAGPGPGWATSDDDVGLMKELWKLRDEDLLPVLGICLGFQSLALAFGAGIERLVEPKHGLVSEILHKDKSIFSGVDQLLATQYHSLQANIGHAIQTKRAVRYPGELWKPTAKCPELEPLAWDFDNRNNGAVLMAVQHVQKPFCGVQFHPESVCTNGEGSRIIQNWWANAQVWNRRRSLRISASLPKAINSQMIASKQMNFDAVTVANLIAHGDGKSLLDLPPEIVHCATTGSGRLTVADVCELFNLPDGEAIVLESGLQPDLLPLKVGTGRYSIVGLVIPGETLRMHYYTDSHILQLRNGNDKVHWEGIVPDPWTFLRTIMQHLKPRQTPSGPTFAPFWGGFMGYASYEAGLQTIDVPAAGKLPYPDICFAYITRSIVFDHSVKKIYVQSIRGQDDKAWVTEALEKVYEAVGQKSQSSTPSHTPMSKPDPFETDSVLNDYLSSCEHVITDQTAYCEAVAECQDYIANGHSYELCLTTQNSIRATKPHLSPAENNSLSWNLYKRLTSQNPAPFSAYLRLHNLHVLSSSPERYISWTRNQTAQCRPIKGTVRKTPTTTYADALAILSSSKERAENLMIVDLVRHQLHGVYGSGNVRVDQLMQIEEYETLWQLVSVVDAVPRGVRRARTPDEWEDPIDYVSGRGTSPWPRTSASSPENGAEDEIEDDADAMLGFDAFVQSLPPGSMTGAPKKRSCELLSHLERKTPRGIYAGVLGYLDVGGAGDFSVVIRTAVKVDDDGPKTTPPPSSTRDTDVDHASAPRRRQRQHETWTLGAGGAVTAQSTPIAEFDEMRGKFLSTARPFGHLPTRTAHPTASSTSICGSAADGPEAGLSDVFSLLAGSAPRQEVLRELLRQIVEAGAESGGDDDEGDGRLRRGIMEDVDVDVDEADRDIGI